MKYKKSLIASLFLVVLSLTIFFWLSMPASSISTTKLFVINQGDSLDTIATRLRQSGLVKNIFVFKLNTYILRLHNKLRAGSFYLDPSWSISKISRSLASGGSQDNWLTILEGWNNQEIATYLEVNNFFSAKSFLFLAKDKQGYIFPDTYSLPKHQTLEFFINLTLSNFDQKIAQAKQKESLDISQDQAVIIASMLEREANNLVDKQLVSGIIQNRLRVGMPLQIDATVAYARDSLYPPSKYWQPISKADLAIKHSANTYLNPGLPPQPICNPSYNALFAALNPTPSQYFYYLTGKDGQMYYAVNLDQHNQNIRRYLR